MAVTKTENMQYILNVQYIPLKKFKQFNDSFKLNSVELERNFLNIRPAH